MQRQSESALVFMTKWPEPGRAKTRLSPPLTPSEAAELARCFLLDMLAGAAAVDLDCLLAFSPVGACEQFRDLVGPRVGLIPAEAPNLGVALLQAQRSALQLGYHDVAVVGSDLPHLSPACYRQAFALLAAADVVLGPSGDGGYYLLAARSETPVLFDRIPWSTATVYERTLERAAEANLRVASIASCDDVDTAADLPSLAAALRACPGAGHTLRSLERLPLFAAAQHHGNTLPDSPAERMGNGSYRRSDPAGVRAG